MRERMTMPWVDFEVFLAVHRECSLSKAARVLGVDQSTVSRRLAALERGLGQPLFARSKTGVHPTAVADRWRPIAERAEAACREARVVAAAAGEAVEGDVRIALPEVIADYVVAPALPELLEAYPGVRVALDTRIELADLGRLEADLAVRFVRPERGDLLVRRLGSTRFGVYGHRDYLQARREAPLERLDWVSWGETQAGLPEARWLATTVGVPPRVRCNRATTILAAALAGAGVALLPERFARGLPVLEERVVPGGVRFEVDVWLVRPRVMRDAPAVEAAAQWLAAVFERMP